MTLTREEVEHIAVLAHLDLDEESKLRYQEQLSAILDHAERLQALDTEAISPTATVLPLRTVLRSDEASATFSHKEALANGPQIQDHCFVVPPPW